MKFNKFITSNYKDDDIYDIDEDGVYKGGVESTRCLYILVIFVLFVYLLTGTKCINMFIEKFDTYTSTINPKLIKNPKTIFNNDMAQKKLLFDSAYNFATGCDKRCLDMENNLSGKSICLQENNSIAELGAKNINKNTSYDWLPVSETFSTGKACQYNNCDTHDSSCSRPQFIEGRLNDEILTRTWSFCGDTCKALKINKNNWDYADESFSGNKRTVDSKVLPFRSLPEYKKMTEPFLVNNVMENQNLLTYAAEKSSPIKKSFGFDQNTKCCHSDNEKASVFQNMDETMLSNSIRLLDYASGDIKYSDLDSSIYDDIKELPTMDNQIY